MDISVKIYGNPEDVKRTPIEFRSQLLNFDLPDLYVLLSNRSKFYEDISNILASDACEKVASETPKILLTVIFERDTTNHFTDILKVSGKSNEEYLKILIASVDYFKKPIEICYEIFNKVRKETYKYPEAFTFWQNFTKPADWSHVFHCSRNFPFYKIDSEDGKLWIDINIENIQNAKKAKKVGEKLEKPVGDYPTIMDGNGDKGETKVDIGSDPTQLKNMLTLNSIQKPEDYDEYKQEYDLSKSKKTNFHSLKPITEPMDLTLVSNAYTIMLKYISREIIPDLLQIMVHPATAHIIKYPCMNVLRDYLISNKLVKTYRGFIICYSYAMYILRHEEIIMFSQVPPTSRVIYSLEEASRAINFINYGDHIENIINSVNPYILQPTNDPLMSSIPFYLPGGDRIIVGREIFDRRFDAATGGCLRGIDLRRFSAAVSGSILVPCVHISPLEKCFNNFETYLEYYYPSYDSLIDAEKEIEVNTAPTVADMKIFTDFVEKYKFLTSGENADAGFVDTTVNATVTTAPSASTGGDEIRYEEEGSEEKKIEIKPTPQPIPSDKITKKLYEFEPVEQSLLSRFNEIAASYKLSDGSLKSLANGGIGNLSDIDISITARTLNQYITSTLEIYSRIRENCKSKGEVWLRPIKTVNSIKFKIYGPGVPRPIDIFRIPTSPLKMVKKFHLNMVKMYYDGDIYMFRCCVATLLSGVGEYYRWFSCNKIPANVILKYIQRGFSVVLNKKEKIIFQNYLKQSKLYSKVMEGVDNVYGMVDYKHQIFDLSKFNTGVRENLKPMTREIEGTRKEIRMISNLNRDKFWHGVSKVNPPPRNIIRLTI
jgi:hypothetical protein